MKCADLREAQQESDFAEGKPTFNQVPHREFAATSADVTPRGCAFHFRAAVSNDVARGTLLGIMPQFVIEREIRGAGSLSDTQLREISLRSLETLEGMGPQIQWLHLAKVGPQRVDSNEPLVHFLRGRGLAVPRNLSPIFVRYSIRVGGESLAFHRC